MISIIVPIYNAAPFLPECLDSLRRQTVTDLQIILIDDGSTDDSLPIARRIAAEDTRVEIYEQAHAGQSAARNLGLSHAKGEFIAFVDADDTIALDWCAQHLAAIEGVDYVQSGYQRIQDSEIKSRKTPCHQYQFTSPCMRLYRRSVLHGMLFERGMIYEDVVWSVDLWMREPTCRIIKYTGYHYTLNPDSTTSRPHPEAQRMLFEVLKARVQKASLRGKAIIFYTIIRLKLHYLKQ